MGDTIALAALLNDVGFATGASRRRTSRALGFLGLDAAAMSTFLSRRGRRRAIAITRRTAELRRRTRELRQALSELEAAREEELGRKEQLAVVGELAAVIAHEVRNPLAIIANAVAGLRKATLTPEDQATLLVDPRRGDEPAQPARLGSPPLRATGQRAAAEHLAPRSARARAPARRLDEAGERRARVRGGGHAAVWGDANLLRQVFDNLIDNAVQAMRRRRDAHRARARDGARGIDGLAVDIIDTGEGMDTMVRSRARDPFFTTRPSGTGLGLAIVDRIVDAHGGKFLIESRAGEGTTATVFLPCGSPSEPPPKSKGPRPQPSSPQISGEKAAKASSRSRR